MMMATMINNNLNNAFMLTYRLRTLQAAPQHCPVFCTVDKT